MSYLSAVTMVIIFSDGSISKREKRKRFDVQRLLSEF